jgi:hypothetical protein
VGNNGGSLYRFHLTTDRMHVDVSADPRLADRVADNLFSLTKFEGTESETLQIGKGFGTTPSIEWNLPRFVGDSSLEGDGFEPVWGFSCQVMFLVCCRFFVKGPKG